MLDKLGNPCTEPQKDVEEPVEVTEATFSRLRRSKTPVPRKKKTTALCVTVPVGLAEGNTLIVISPLDETQKFPVKIPKGAMAGDVFPVSVPKADTQDEEHVVESFFDVIMGQACGLAPDDEVKQLDWKEKESVDLLTALDEYLTPTPEQAEAEPEPKKEDKAKEDSSSGFSLFGDAKSKQVDTDSETDASDTDIGAALDDFFTPTPEVVAFYQEIEQ